MVAKFGSIKPKKRKSCNEKGEYQCSKCNEWKLPSEFNKNKSQTTGLNYSCRECSRKHTRKYNLPTKYGITEEQYDKMLTDQLTKCDCCGIMLVDGGDYKKRPVVDHNHKTGEVRSLLCHKCNLALGNIDDSSDYALLLHKYLKRHRC